ncbi:hypothetical protein GGQ74_003107 [Desulfobaculum xiamenense]|uniref:Uncharacterized protein n=1 Tax=Desulfobaculum xiamenense TaxID=995050 RepID=A0A846QV26_9BACT|nr:hypothetical protein [Desulfobaculum xiamenense]NJB69405.1 hypothetical protein [Desulfobaculum xiamenense]
MQYTEADIPVVIKHGEILGFSDGTTVRFESNGEAKDVFFGDEWTPTIQLFPANDYAFQAGGKAFKLTALFEDALKVEKA